MCVCMYVLGLHLDNLVCEVRVRPPLKKDCHDLAVTISGRIVQRSDAVLKYNYKQKSGQVD